MGTQSEQLPEAGEVPVVIFSLAAEHYGLEIQSVQEIVRMQAITAIPGPDSWVEGVTNLRGRVVPIIDLRKRCGIEASETTAESRIIVVSSERGMVGLIVDAVSEVLRIPVDQIEPPAALVSVVGNSFIRGIAKLPDRLVSLMDLERLLSNEDTDSAAEPAENTAAAA